MVPGLRLGRRRDSAVEHHLDLGWSTLAECFRPDEVGIKQEFIDKHWPKDKTEVSCNVGTNQAQ